MSEYNQYAQDNSVNIIPEEDFKRLVRDTFRVISSAVGATAGPYGSQVMMTMQNQSTTTKDGYNTFCGLSFRDPYKKMVYLAIKNICERVNNTVGDGTTSCILIAEALFNELNDIIGNPNDKRMLLEILGDIETLLMCVDTDMHGEKLHKDTLNNLVMMSANYDKALVNKIIEAFDPMYDEDGYVVSIRNVIPEQLHNMDGMETKIETMELPGDYHVRIRMEPADIEEFTSRRENVRVVLYDHAMTESEWLTLEKPVDPNDSLIIIARDFTKGCLDKCIARYARDKMLVGERNNVFPCWILGSVQTELKDLGAVLGCDIHSLVFTDKITYEECTPVDMEIFNNNCMGFYINNKKHPDLCRYIEKLKDEMYADISNSIISHEKYSERIKALQMDSRDTLITCSGTSSLEMSMIMDKIADCIAIVNSAYKYGTVPNLLAYGYSIIDKAYKVNKNEMSKKVLKAILNSIEKLFTFIHVSKYATIENLFSSISKETYEKRIYDFYHQEELTKSFNVINEQMVDYGMFPTSAEYDREVLVAAISIVKYLITSKSLIYDATMAAPFE